MGGIKANNDFPVEFLLENLQIQNNVIRAAHQTGVRKLLFLGSSCIYPKHAPQPIPESALLTGPLEPTNEAYAIAKIAGIKLCQAYAREYGANFISAMPTNLYGPNDNFDLLSSHVLPALLRKAHEAKTRWRARDCRLGLGQTAARISACRRSGRGLPFPAGEIRLARDHQCRLGRRYFDPRTGRTDLRDRRFRGRTGLGREQARRHAAQASRCFQAARASAGSHTIALREGIARTYEWFLQNRAAESTSAMKKLRVGVVGVGHIGKNHARLYAELPQRAIHRDLRHRSRAGATARGRIWRRRGRVRSKNLPKQVDAASIATPTNTHFEIAPRTC